MFFCIVFFVVGTGESETNGLFVLPETHMYDIGKKDSFYANAMKIFRACISSSDSSFPMILQTISVTQSIGLSKDDRQIIFVCDPSIYHCL